MNIDISALQSLPEVDGSAGLLGKDFNVYCWKQTCVYTGAIGGTTIVVVYAKNG
jgi:hypothetical protein